MPVKTDQPATENFGEEDPISKLEKEFRSLNEPLDEAAYIARLAQRVAGVSVLNKQTQNQDVLNLKKLAGI
jgi:predicted RNase H-like nuclease (RuvC/YqgF family)